MRCSSIGNRALERCVALLVVAGIVGAPGPGLAQTGGFETPPVLRAQDVAPKALLAGDGFHVEERVETEVPRQRQNAATRSIVQNAARPPIP
jgi:hypothetical protein